MKVFYWCIPLVALIIGACSVSVNGPSESKTVSLAISSPDSVGLLDNIIFAVSCSAIRDKHWDYSWDFGDSALLLHDSIASHVYRSVGFRMVTVKLIDTSTHATISSAKKQIKIGNITLPVLSIESADTVHPGDPVAFRVHVSTAIKSSWKYRWDFGDSTTLVTDSIASHQYATEGNYVVAVSLVDTATNFQICSTSKNLTVFAPRFDWNLLRQYHHVTISAYGMATHWHYYGSENDGYHTDTVRQVDSGSFDFHFDWDNNKFHFLYDTAFGFLAPLVPCFKSSTVFYDTGAIDPSFTGLAILNAIFTHDSTAYPNGVNEGCSGSGYDNRGNFGWLPFKTQNAGSIVFEAIGARRDRSSFWVSHSTVNGVRVFTKTDSYSMKIDWLDTSIVRPRVTVTFAQ